MTFARPEALALLLLAPLLVLLYRRVTRAPSGAVRFPWLVAAPAAARRRLWAHLPAALVLIAWLVTAVSVARPHLPWPTPALGRAIVLTLDVSGSMRSEDMVPNRMIAAKEAAKAFVRATPRGVPVALVVFGGFAERVVPPVTDRQRLLEAIEQVGIFRRTAIGEGLLEALRTLPAEARRTPDPGRTPDPQSAGIIILLSDGRSNTGILPLEAAQQAREQGVRVYTVGVGQPVSSERAWTIGGPLDEETLSAMASLTGGQYYHASSAEGLRDVYTRLARITAWERRPQEVSAVAAALAAAALVAAVVIGRALVHPLPL